MMFLIILHHIADLMQYLKQLTMVSLEFVIQFSSKVRLTLKYVIFELIEVALQFEGAFSYDFFYLVNFALPVFVRVFI